ncbi:MAG TPA: YbaK/EbsC family protein [Anaerolineales bacterium]|nr:YbaK/EbsC family protein [Anaerolineales bacterium]
MAKKKKSISKTMPMRALDEKGIPYEIRQQAGKEYTAEGVAEDLGVPVAQVVKAMLVQRSASSDPGRSEFVLIVIPGDRRLSLKKVGLVLDDKKVQMASLRDVERVTGFQVGAVSVLGFRRQDIPGYVDRHVLELEQVIISAGRPDVGLCLQPQNMVQAIHSAQIDDLCEDQGYE